MATQATVYQANLSTPKSGVTMVAVEYTDTAPSTDGKLTAAIPLEGTYRSVTPVSCVASYQHGESVPASYSALSAYVADIAPEGVKLGYAAGTDAPILVRAVFECAL
jgi:hypothetical protein